MGIRFQCEHCQTRLNVKSHQAGKQGRCPKCGSAILIPSQSTLNAPSSAPSPVGTEQATLNFSKTELLRPEDVGGTVVETRPAPVDNFSVAEDTNSNASDDSIALTTSPTPPMADPDSFLLGKPKNKALLPDGPDPIQEDPRKVWYIRNHKHSEIGPIPGSQLQQMLDDKKVLPGSYLWREDWEDWEKGEAIFSSLGNLSDSPSDVAKKSNVRSQAGPGAKSVAHPPGGNCTCGTFRLDPGPSFQLISSVSKRTDWRLAVTSQDSESWDTIRLGAHPGDRLECSPETWNSITFGEHHV